MNSSPRVSGTATAVGASPSYPTSFFRTVRSAPKEQTSSKALKAVLSHLNRGPHIVLVSTHDIELAELLDSDGYELHHFREEVVDGQLVFDYQLHTGPLTTRNAIRILELYDYPPELIAEAYAVQERLLKKPE